MTLSQLERDLATLESFTHNTPVKEVFDRIKKELSGSDQICCLGSDHKCIMNVNDGYCADGTGKCQYKVRIN